MSFCFRRQEKYSDNSKNILEIKMKVLSLKNEAFDVIGKQQLLVSRFIIPVEPKFQDNSIPPTIIGDFYVSDSTFGLALYNIRENFQVKVPDMKLLYGQKYQPYRAIRVRKGKYSMEISPLYEYYKQLLQETEINAFPKVVEFEWSGVNIKNYFLEHHPTTAFLSGDMILKIEYEQLVNQPSLPRLNNTFKTKLYKSLAQEKNFTITCQGESFYFNKTILSSLSEVFERMIQNPDTKEAKENAVDIKDFNLETIKTFEKMMAGNDKITIKEFTMDLKMFANKYLIEPLEKECSYNIMNNLSKENIFDVVTGAYLGNDEELLMAAFKFVKAHMGNFQRSDGWNQLMQTYPECLTRMMNFLLCNGK